MRRQLGFEVMAERCDECLFGRDPIVSDDRRRAILADLVETDRHFVCHKATIARSDDGSLGVCCRGDYDRDPARTNAMRMAGRLDIVHFVAERDL